MRDIIQKLETTQNANDKELFQLINNDEINPILYEVADKVRKKNYGIDVYLRGLIEFSNICKNNCYYCGIRKDNSNVERYCLTKEQILECCQIGYDLGYKTFVLQGGENSVFSDIEICQIVSKIKEQYSDCAITLSIGEKSKESYKKYFNAGAERYLLRHETANEEHYSKLHPSEMSLKNRKQCLWNLKEIGYQVGSGFMVGSPYQTTENLIEDIRFLQELQPDMIGIGMFLSHNDTPFREFSNGSLDLTLKMISILRLIFPYALIPATTALGTISPIGRELGLKAGANVVMPNLSPKVVRKNYQLYDNKICTGEEAAECKGCLERRVKSVGYTIVSNRGDVKKH